MFERKRELKQPSKQRIEHTRKSRNPDFSYHTSTIRCRMVETLVRGSRGEGRWNEVHRWMDNKERYWGCLSPKTEIVRWEIPPQNHLAIASIELVGCMAGVADLPDATMRQWKHVSIFMHIRRFWFTVSKLIHIIPIIQALICLAIVRIRPHSYST